MWTYTPTDELFHHGVKGMKWGVRRYQNADGTLTLAGRRRYAKDQYRERKRKAIGEYSDAIAEITRPYKSGQQLSKADAYRETAADKKYTDDVARAKAEYKKAKSDIRAQSKWDRDVRKNWGKAYNRTVDEVNSKLEDFNAQWEKKGGEFGSREYVESYCKLWNDTYTNALESTFGRSPIDTGKKWSESVPMFMKVDDLMW